MNIDQLMSRHEAETDKLIAEIKAYRSRPREACDHMIYDGFAAQVKSFKNLGLRLYAVEDAERELMKLAAEIFPELAL